MFPVTADAPNHFYEPVEHFTTSNITCIEATVVASTKILTTDTILQNMDLPDELVDAASFTVDEKNENQLEFPHQTYTFIYLKAKALIQLIYLILTLFLGRQNIHTQWFWKTQFFDP